MAAERRIQARDAKGRFISTNPIYLDSSNRPELPTVVSHEWTDEGNGYPVITRRTRPGPPSMWMRFARWLRFRSRAR